MVMLIDQFILGTVYRYYPQMSRTTAPHSVFQCEDVAVNKNAVTILRIGLAAVFLANGLTAFLEPQEFADLLSGSFISQIIPLQVATMVLLVGIHDTLMCILMLGNVARKYVFGWACLWLIGVMVIIGEPLDILEHLGFFVVALVLYMDAAPNFRGISSMIR